MSASVDWVPISPGDLGALEGVLTWHTLDPRFERSGDFVYTPHYSALAEDGRTPIDGAPMFPDKPDARRFFGNFFELSHVFRFDCDDAATIARLTGLIRVNQASLAYAAAKAKAAK